MLLYMLEKEAKEKRKEKKKRGSYYNVLCVVSYSVCSNVYLCGMCCLVVGGMVCLGLVWFV